MGHGHSSNHEYPELAAQEVGIMPAKLAQNLATVFGVEGSHATLLNEQFAYADLVISSGIAAGPPHTIPPSALQKYGPRTREAVVLTGINRMFAPVAQAFGDAIATDWFQKLSAEERLYAWTAMLSGVVAEQPIAFHSGLVARNLQHNEIGSLADWPLAANIADLPLTRAETPDTPPRSSNPAYPYWPRILTIIDEAVPRLGLEHLFRGVDTSTDVVLRALGPRLGPYTGSGRGMLQIVRAEYEPDKQAYKVANMPHLKLARLVTQEVLRAGSGPRRAPPFPNEKLLNSLPDLVQKAVLVGAMALHLRAEGRR